MTVVVVFASRYLNMSARDPQAFNEHLNRTSSLYFTVVTLATIGYGDIAPRTDVARTVVMIQVVVNIVILGSAIKVIAGARPPRPFPGGRRARTDAGRGLRCGHGRGAGDHLRRRRRDAGRHWRRPGEYTLAILRQGPAYHDEAARPIVWEHGRRNFGFRADGVLNVVCPVLDDSDVCGIGIFDASVAEVEAIMAGDPGVQAGVFVVDVHPCRSFPGDALAR